MVGCEGAAAGHEGGEAGASPRRGEEDGDELGDASAESWSTRSMGATPSFSAARATASKPHPTGTPPVRAIGPSSASAPAAITAHNAVHKVRKPSPLRVVQSVVFFFF